MIKEYIAYLKDNPEGYWFKRKLYGWGWTPAKWQGWAVILGFILILAALVSTLDGRSSTKEVSLMFVLPFVILLSAFIGIMYKKGEKPRWQWGLKKDK